MVSWVGGVRSGRIPGPLPAVTQDDFAIDGILAQNKSTPLEPQSLAKLLGALSRCSPIFFEDEPIRIIAKPLSLEAELIDDMADKAQREKRESMYESYVKDGTIEDTEDNKEELEFL